MFKKTNKFTIIELMIALIIFSMMMGMVMYFFSQSQRAWQDSDGLVRVFQNARTIFEVIENDLLQAKSTKTKGQMIPFAIVENKGDTAFGPFPYMVCKTSPSTKARSTLAEVSYTVGTITSADQRTEDSAGKPLNYFKRSSVFDYISDGTVNSAWDFYNVAPGTDVSWTKGNGVKSFPVVGGVLELRMSYYRLMPTLQHYKNRASATQNKTYFSMPRPGDFSPMDYKEVSVGETFTSLPQYLEIELTLYDYVTESAEKCNKTKRTFYKRIYLDQGSRAYNNQQLYSN